MEESDSDYSASDDGSEDEEDAKDRYVARLKAVFPSLISTCQCPLPFIIWIVIVILVFGISYIKSNYQIYMISN